MITENSNCNGTNGNGYCVCNEDLWAYNGSICVPSNFTTSQITFLNIENAILRYDKYSKFYTLLLGHRVSSWAWSGKRIVNGVCEIHFSAIFDKFFEIFLGDKEDYKNGISHLHIRN